MPRFEITHVGEADELVQPVRGETSHRLEHETHVIAQFEPVDDATGEPGRGVVEHRDSERPLRPLAQRELVDLVTGAPAEQFRDLTVPAFDEMDHQALRIPGHSEGVVAFGQPDQKPPRVDAGL